jgi:hypothetical protein
MQVLEIDCNVSAGRRLWFCAVAVAVAVADLVRACRCIVILGQICMVSEQE